VLIGVQFGASAPNLRIDVRASFDPALAGFEGVQPTDWSPASIAADPKKRAFITRIENWAKNWRVAIRATGAGEHAPVVMPFP
jgi:hypothetical protein